MAPTLGDIVGRIIATDTIGGSLERLRAADILPPAPRIGEHGADILAEIGIDPMAIARLRAENILLIPKAS
jgi:crotonobetainyl-CoA:carnitine CoA-transferase CaiB-like acyl-CoA transferase